MAPADADEDDEQEQDARYGKSYGTTYIGDSSHAHLGDVLQNINLSGEVHLHIHNLRRTVAEPERAQDVRRTCRLSLQALRNVLQELCDRLGDNQHQTPESRCVVQLATKTVTEIDAVLDAEAQHEIRPRSRIRRLKSRTGTEKCTQKKLELFCRNVEDRLNMIKYLLDAQHDDKAKLGSSSPQSGARTVTALDGSKCNTNIIKLKLVLALPKLELSKADLNALLARFSNEVMALWTATNAVFMICCYRFSIYLPQMIPIYLMLTRLPRLLALGDTFTFYDASNTKAELTVTDFSHWDIFRTRLECKFRGTPGEDTVLGGNYILTGSHMSDLVINASNWQESIKEGIIIYMAANVLGRHGETDRCPRCQAELKLEAKFHPSGNACARCGLASLRLMMTNTSAAFQLPLLNNLAASSTASAMFATSVFSPQNFPHIAPKGSASDPMSIFNRINVTSNRWRPPDSLNASTPNLFQRSFMGEGSIVQQMVLLKQLRAQYPNASQSELQQMLVQKTRELYARQHAHWQSVMMRQNRTNGMPQPLNMDMAFLRHNPHIQQLKRTLQQQPQSLESILQQLGADNPQLAQLIANNPEEFVDFLAEDDEDESEVDPQQHSIIVTEEDCDAIERLGRLGFQRDIADAKNVGKYRRVYPACESCLEARVKCDHGDVDNPLPESCVRCKRTGKDCLFLRVKSSVKD